jgi:hypothetical protein
MVLEMLVFSPLNHLTRLVAPEFFILQISSSNFSVAILYLHITVEIINVVELTCEILVRTKVTNAVINFVY